MTKTELNRTLGRVQIMKGLYESGFEPITDCGFYDFLKPYIQENWEKLDYEKVDLIVESHMLTVLPSYRDIDIIFTALLERVNIDG